MTPRDFIFNSFYVITLFFFIRMLFFRKTKTLPLLLSPLFLFFFLRLNIVPICFLVSLEFRKSMSAIFFTKIKADFSVCTFSWNSCFCHVGVFSIEHYQGCGKFVNQVILGFLFPFHIPDQINFSFAYDCFFLLLLLFLRLQTSCFGCVN